MHVLLFSFLLSQASDKAPQAVLPLTLNDYGADDYFQRAMDKNGRKILKQAKDLGLTRSFTFNRRLGKLWTISRLTRADRLSSRLHFSF